MQKEKMTIERRLENIKNLYYNLDEFIDKFPDIVPNGVKETLKNLLKGNEELKQLMQGIDESRPPRFLLVGRTGVGKSSLINAICGLYVAGVSDVKIGTRKVERFQCKEGERTLLEILDTRGIGESLAVEKGYTAEEVLQSEIIEFRPDAILFVLNISARDYINIDTEYVKSLIKYYKKETNVDIPVFVVLNRADAIAPAQYTMPTEYPPRKLDNIKEACYEVERIMKEVGLRVEAIVPVSSLIDWGHDPEEIEKMEPSKLEKMQIEFDGRYNISKLIEKLEGSMEVDASMGLLFAAGLDEVLDRIANKIIGIFTGIAGVVTANPLPVTDLVILTTLETVMVSIIAYLSGEKINLKSAEKFVGSLFGIGIGGNVFRMTARQLSKLIPGAGSMISAGIACGGMYIIGKAAVQYYIYGKSLSKVTESVKKMRKEVF